MRATIPMEPLRIPRACHFGKFCTMKRLALIHSKMEESLFGDLEHCRQALVGDQIGSRFYNELRSWLPSWVYGKHHQIIRWRGSGGSDSWNPSESQVQVLEMGQSESVPFKLSPSRIRDSILFPGKVSNLRASREECIEGDLFMKSLPQFR